MGLVSFRGLASSASAGSAMAMAHTKPRDPEHKTQARPCKWPWIRSSKFRPRQGLAVTLELKTQSRLCTCYATWPCTSSWVPKAAMHGIRSCKDHAQCSMMQFARAGGRHRLGEPPVELHDRPWKVACRSKPIGIYDSTIMRTPATSLLLRALNRLDQHRHSYYSYICYGTLQAHVRDLSLDLCMV